MMPRTLCSTLFPYTTLFRSVHFWALPVTGGARTQLTSAEGRQDVVVSPDGKTLVVLASTANHPAELFFQQNHRSEEHTSELQSPMYLVCRLLLEKKKDIHSQ